MNRKRILFVSDAIGLGGGESSLFNILASSENRDNLSFLGNEGVLYQRLKNEGVAVYSIRLEKFRWLLKIIPIIRFRSIPGIIRILRKNAIEVIHIESLLSFYYLFIPSLVLSIPIYCTYHGFWADISRIVKWVVSKHIKKFFIVSKSIEADLSFVKPRERIVHVPLSVSERIETYDFDNEQVCVRKRHKLPNGRSIILVLARFQPIKGQLRALEIYQKIAYREDVILMFVGGVIPGSSSESKQYYDKVRLRSKGNDNILFIDAVNDVRPYLAQADVLLIPSDFESFGMVAIESFYMKTPVVASNVGGLSETIKNGETGFLCDISRIDDFANTIEHLITNKEVKFSIVNKAYDEAKNIYSSKRRLFKYYSEYD